MKNKNSNFKLKLLIKSSLEPIFNKLGFIRKDLITFSNGTENKDALINNFFNLLKQNNFKPKHIVDVGANRGYWTKEVIKVFPNAYYTLFEPQKDLQKYMSDFLGGKIECNAVGVGSSSGTFKFTIVDRDDSCNFRMSEEEANKKGMKQVDIDIVTLNSFFAKTKKPKPDLIKIDAEGLDLEVLKGATDFLGKTEVILIEASVVSPAFSNDMQTVINTMDSYGYKLFDITDLNRPFSNKVLWLVELAFVLKNGTLDKINWQNR